MSNQEHEMNTPVFPRERLLEEIHSVVDADHEGGTSHFSTFPSFQVDELTDADLMAYQRIINGELQEGNSFAELRNAEVGSLIRELAEERVKRPTQELIDPNKPSRVVFWDFLSNLRIRVLREKLKRDKQKQS